METVRQVLVTHWHFMRWLRLVVGIIILIQAFQLQSMLYGILAVFFLFQAATNSGCCGAKGCAIPSQKNDRKNI
ncbi:MAG TPA: hypothetical protein VK766_02260 [Cytophagaceae bacterium]|jgi:hypothetical protein|nr:hypothetical protein [Cytophagaceae bacterium]